MACPSYSQVLTNQQSDWGNSIFDQRHRFTIAYVWQVPHFHHNAFLRALTDQWEWSGIATIETGTPNTVEIGFDNILTAMRMRVPISKIQTRPWI